MTFLKTKHILAGILLIGSIFLTASIQADTYTVKAGDTLSEIAAVFQTSADELARLNQIENKNLIMIGQVLKTNQAVTAATQETVNAVVPPAPVVEEEVPVQEVAEAPVQTPAPAPAETHTAPASVGITEAQAKEEIARRESGGSYTAQNGQYYGRYQLTISYLNGDLSPENQERVADAYVAGRYGSWVAALAFSDANGWY